LLKPVLIVTCRVSSEEWCIEEIGNVIFPIDPGLKIVKTKYPGLIIVYSRLDSRSIYEIVLKKEYGFVQNIIPIDIHGLFNIDFFSQVKNLVYEGERIKLKLRIRGRRGLSRIVWKKLIEFLAEKSVYHDKYSNTCIYVEVIDNDIYMGRGYC